MWLPPRFEWEVNTLLGALSELQSHYPSSTRLELVRNALHRSQCAVFEDFAHVCHPPGAPDVPIAHASATQIPVWCEGANATFAHRRITWLIRVIRSSAHRVVSGDLGSASVPQKFSTRPHLRQKSLSHSRATPSPRRKRSKGKFRDHDGISPVGVQGSAITIPRAKRVRSRSPDPVEKEWPVLYCDNPDHLPFTGKFAKCSLRKHMQTALHNGQRLPCPAPGCPKTFLRQWPLKEHAKNEHNIRIKRSRDGSYEYTQL